jgi:nucleoside 2-deoxyribosyltransferase
MDSGTAFEVGFMRALGRPVLGYTNVAASYRERTEHYRRVSPGLLDADAADIEIEDFDGAENLMIEAAILAIGGLVVRNAVPRGEELRDLSGLEACLMQAARIMDARP